MSTTIGKVILGEGVQKYSSTKSILLQLKDIPVRKERDESLEEIPDVSDEMKMDMGKDTVHLVSYQGEFLKPCPGTKEYICCGYQILNVGTNCPLDCSYCILQAYFNRPNLRIHVNLEEQLGQVFQTIDSEPDRIFRVGTGEFTDSLALDPVTRWSEMILPGFSRRKNAVLELKTKTANTRGLLESEYRDRIIVSWSLNSPFISQREEHRAASLAKRLECARECQSAGFTIGFHFDPLILHRDWMDEYKRTVDLMDKYIEPEGIIWISLGSFRFMPALKPIIRRRHPETSVLDGEFVLGLDGKMRYFKPIRMELYSFLRELLCQWHPDLGLYLCMESDEVWQASMGWTPETSEGLRIYLDERVRKFFG